MGLRIRKAEEFSTFYYYTKQQLKKKDNCREREKYNQIKIRRPSETLCENFKHYEYEKKKVKNNYSRVRKRRPRKFCYYHTKKLHLSTLKYKNTNSMDKKREKIIILTFDNITNLPKITLIPHPNTPSLFYGMPKTNFLSFFLYLSVLLFTIKNTIY